jgi:hypothetical protein
MPRLYLATPDVGDPQSLLASLPRLLAGADVAAVLLRLKPADPRTMISRIKTLAPAIQDKGAALLLDGHAELVARAGADGAHLTGIAALEDALPSLKPDRIAGVGGLETQWRRANWAQTMCCSANPTQAGSGHRVKQSPSACNGGTSCSSRHASASRARPKRSGDSPRQARISFWSAISFGPIRVARWRR